MALAYFSTVGVIGLVSGIVGPTLNALAAQTGVSLSLMGLALTTRSLGYLVGASGGGTWVDRRGAHRILAVVLGVAAVCLAVVPFAGKFWLLLAIVALLGWALGGLDVAGNSLTLRAYGDRAAGYINALHLFFGLGGLAAPFLVSIVLRLTGDVDAAYWLLALVPIPAILYLFRHPAPKIQSSRERSPALRASGITLAFVLSTTLYFFYVGGQIGLVSWLFVYIETYAGTNLATYATGGFWAAFSLFRLLGVPISRRWAPRKILVIDYSVVIAAAVPLILWPDHPVALWIGVLGVGAAHASIYATGILLLGERAPLTGKQMSVLVAMTCGGNMLFPWMMGSLLPILGPRVIPGLSTALMAASFAVVLGVFRYHDRQSDPIEARS